METTTAVQVQTPGGGLDTPAQDMGSGTAVAVAVGAQEVQAAVILAKKFPRDENAAFAKMLRSCNRVGFADRARYGFRRGTTNVVGPSVYMAREMARCWGNVRYGLRVIGVEGDTVHLAGWAWDLETNNYSESQAQFSKLVQRKVWDERSNTSETKWVTPDERDLRELVNRHGAIAYRNALLQIMPPDVVEDLMEASRKTLERAAAGDLKTDRDKLIRSLVATFDQYGVTTAMIEGKLGNPLAQITEQQVADLREYYAALRDDPQVSAKDIFGGSGAPTKTTDAPASDLESELAAEESGDEDGAEAEAEETTEPEEKAEEKPAKPPKKKAKPTPEPEPEPQEKKGEDEAPDELDLDI